MWENRSGKFTTSKKVNVDFCLLELSTTKIMPWKCHIGNSANGRYDTILGRDIITALLLDIGFY